MDTYHKINAPFKRHMTGPDKGQLIVGEWALPEFEYLADNKWEFTEKVDGTNIRIGMWAGFEEPEFGGRTDRAVIPKPLLTYLRDMFTVELFETAGLHIDSITLYGEGYGPNIQGGGKYREDVSFVLFDVRIGDFWLKRDDVNDIALKLGIDSVPVLGTGTLWDAIRMVSGTQTIWGRGDNYGPHPSGPLQSQWGDFEAEGIVARPVVPLFNRMGDRIITKIKGKDFK